MNLRNLGSLVTVLSSLFLFSDVRDRRDKREKRDIFDFSAADLFLHNKNIPLG